MLVAAGFAAGFLAAGFFFAAGFFVAADAGPAIAAPAATPPATPMNFLRDTEFESIHKLLQLGNVLPTSDPSRG